ELYGFAPVETPSIENLTTLLGKYGEEGDQLLYRILHRRDALKRALEADDISESTLSDLGLRYDLTVPLARVVAQYGDLPRFFKRYQIQPVWRADRPGRGRFREFYQCDVDVTGTSNLIAEADVLSAVARVLEELGFSDFTIQVNHRQLLAKMISAAGIDPTLEESALVAVDKLEKVGRDGVLGELEQRGIESGQAESLLQFICRDGEESNQAIAERLRSSLDSEKASAAIDQLLELLETTESGPAGGHLRLSPGLARWLGYYTGPIFEITVTDLAGSLGGGGRYDDLVGMFGKQAVPAVGFSLGLERILLVMEEREMYPPLQVGPQLVLCSMGVEPASVFKVAEALREQGLRVEIYPEPAKLGKQLQYADSEGVKSPCAAILGEDELNNGTLTLKALASGAQSTVPIPEVSARLEALLEAPAAG
ncbi:MAG: histidine--tRNA ligase, partial [Planctomycetes bacterium]|nr:histidine--tRNA ligase [Planctomycetota bacterium]